LYVKTLLRLCKTDVDIDPVLLCNELGADSNGSHTVESSGRTQISVKDAVQIARDNNFMGLICSSRLLVRTPLRNLTNLNLLSRLWADWRRIWLLPSSSQSKQQDWSLSQMFQTMPLTNRRKRIWEWRGRLATSSRTAWMGF
jgi:hypothetical protein